MSQTFRMRMAETGERKPVDGAQRFSHYIGNIRFWFAVHECPSHVATLAVSHWESGKRCTLISPSEQIAAVGTDRKAQAKLALDKLVQKHGAERVQAVLRAAEA